MKEKTKLLFTLALAVTAGLVVVNVFIWWPKPVPTPPSAEAIHLAAERQLHTMRWQTPSFSREITNERVDVVAKNASDLLDRLGFTDREPEPKPPAQPNLFNAKDAGVVVQERNEAELLRYKRAVAEYEQLHDLWERNKKTRPYQFVTPRTITWVGDDPEKDLTIETARFVYRENLHSYVGEEFLGRTAKWLDAAKADPDFRKAMSWMTMSGEELLREPLKCLEDRSGDCLKQADGQDCLLLAPLAEAINEQTKRLPEDGRALSCFRDNAAQAALYAAVNGACNLPKADYKVGLPGLSFHSLGLAVDLLNHKALSLKLMVGTALSCGFILRDEGHCAVGEYSLNSMKARWKMKFSHIKLFADDVKSAASIFR